MQRGCPLHVVLLRRPVTAQQHPATMAASPLNPAASAAQEEM
ncbi:hypothetical protein [Streptomyces nanshensis]|nr:hypothetical protein [Streptomyces nanshensis]